MKYTLSTERESVYLETIDDEGDSIFYRICGNGIVVTEDVPGARQVLASGVGEWHDGPSFVEFVAKTWKLRDESGMCTTRTGDGGGIAHLYSGLGVGRTGESAARRLIAFFDGTDFRAATPHGC